MTTALEKVLLIILPLRLIRSKVLGDNGAARSLWSGIDSKRESKMTRRGIDDISSARKTGNRLRAIAKKVLLLPRAIDPFTVKIEVSER